MHDILKQISKVRRKLKRNKVDSLLSQKPFAKGMYIFSMFQISYYSRVLRDLKLDYDSFIIIQTVVSHNLYHLKEKIEIYGYEDLEDVWINVDNKSDEFSTIDGVIAISPKNKLTISSICLVTGIPKETTRRKVLNLHKKNILNTSKKNGVEFGIQYKKIFQDFVPETTLEVSKLIKNWEKIGVLKSLLNFKL
jgi:hypothetical protein